MPETAEETRAREWRETQQARCESRRARCRGLAGSATAYTDLLERWAWTTDTVDLHPGEPCEESCDDGSGSPLGN